MTSEPFPSRPSQSLVLTDDSLTELAAEVAVRAQFPERTLTEFGPPSYVVESSVERVIAAGGPGEINITEVVVDEIERRQAFREFNREVLSNYPPDTDWEVLMGGLLASCVAAGQIDVPDPDGLIEKYPDVIMPDGSRIKIRGDDWLLAHEITAEEVDEMTEGQLRDVPSLQGTAGSSDQIGTGRRG